MEQFAYLVHITVSLLIGLLIGTFIGWFAHSYFMGRGGNTAEPVRTLFGIIIVVVWTIAAIMSIFNNFSIPIYFHVFAGLVIAPMFDPEGKLVDRIFGKISNRK